jgi:hypothetical protein
MSTVVVYLLGCSNPQSSSLLIGCETSSLLDYDVGVSENLHLIPSDIAMKLIQPGYELSIPDMFFIRGLRIGWYLQSTSKELRFSRLIGRCSKKPIFALKPFVPVSGSKTEYL